MAGTGAGSFGGGFGQGLAAVLMESRRAQRDKDDKAFAAIAGPALQHGIDTGDYSLYEELVSTHFPGVSKQLKKGSPMQHLPALMKQFGTPVGGGENPTGGPPSLSWAPPQQAGQAPAPTTVAPSQAGEVPAPLPTGGQLQQTPTQPSGTFFGQRMMTPQQRADQEADVNVGARRSVATKMGLPPDQAVDYALYGTREPNRQLENIYDEGPTVPDPNSETGYSQITYLRSNPSVQKRIPAPAPAAAKPTATNTSEFDDFVASYAADKGTTPDKLTAADRLDARKKYSAAQSTAQPQAAGRDPMALARLAVRNPSVLQSLTPTEAGPVLAAIASDPQLRGQFETVKLAPIRDQAQNVLDVLKDLVVVGEPTVDKPTGEVTGLTNGAKWLYGASSIVPMSRVPGSLAANSKAALDQVTGSLVLNLINNLKQQSRTGATGFGQLSARELDVLESSASVLKGNLSEGRALQELKKIYEQFSKIMALSPEEANATPAGINTPAVELNLDSPVYIGPDGRPSATPVGR